MSDSIDRRRLEARVRAEQAAERLAELRPRWLMAPHDKGQRQFLASQHIIRVVIPGNGWGKTSAMAMDIDMAVQKDDPFKAALLPKHPITAVWVCQKFQQMDILRRQLEEDVWTRPWVWNQTKHMYHWPNGGQLHIVSSDSDWQHIQGIPVDIVAFDEHPDRKLWNEFMFRRRGKRKTRFMVAATMTQGMTWFVKEVIQEWENFHKAQGLLPAEARQLQRHKRIWCWDAGGIMDNPAMSQEDVEHYRSISHASSKELKVRLGGGYSDFTGESVFDHDALDTQVKNVSDGEEGSLLLVDPSESPIILPKGVDVEATLRKRIGGRTAKHYVEWLPGGLIDGGGITIWEQPIISEVYVFGADFAAGLVGRDYDAAVVLKKRADGILEQVAEARGWWGDATFAEILYMLGLWYFNAFLCGERQFGLPTLRRLYDEYRYPFIFRGRLESTRARRPSDLLGHHRSPGDTVVPNLRAGIRGGHLILRSRPLMEELRQYQFRPRSATIDADQATSNQLVTGAPSGMNDDLVMALAYAWHAAREAGRFSMPLPEYAEGTYGSVFDNARILRGIKPKEPRKPVVY